MSPGQGGRTRLATLLVLAAVVVVAVAALSYFTFRGQVALMPSAERPAEVIDAVPAPAPGEAPPTRPDDAEPPAPEPASPGHDNAPASESGVKPPSSPRPTSVEPPVPPSSRDEMPAFPWPPPRASALHDLPLAWLVADPATARLRDLDARLTAALDGLGYGERSYFAVPEGYALVTRLERIDADGSPRGGAERWALDDARATSFSLRDYLRALLLARPGYFRVFVFTVTPRAFVATGTPVSASEALAWIGSGFVRLPEAVGAIPLASASFQGTVLIYEFERAAEPDPATVVVPGRVEARQHLVRAGLWGALTR